MVTGAKIVIEPQTADVEECVLGGHELKLKSPKASNLQLAAQALLQSRSFEAGTLFAAISHVIWVSIYAMFESTNAFTGDGAILVDAIDFMFFCYFFSEVVLRWVASTDKCKTLRDPWFLLDLGLVLIMMVELYSNQETYFDEVAGLNQAHGMTHLKILRCKPAFLRIIRLGRLVRFTAMACGTMRGFRDIWRQAKAFREEELKEELI